MKHIFNWIVILIFTFFNSPVFGQTKKELYALSSKESWEFSVPFSIGRGGYSIYRDDIGGLQGVANQYNGFTPDMAYLVTFEIGYEGDSLRFLTQIYHDEKKMDKLKTVSNIRMVNTFRDTLKNKLYGSYVFQAKSNRIRMFICNCDSVYLSKSIDYQLYNDSPLLEKFLAGELPNFTVNRLYFKPLHVNSGNSIFYVDGEQTKYRYVTKKNQLGRLRTAKNEFRTKTFKTEFKTPR